MTVSHQSGIQPRSLTSDQPNVPGPDVWFGADEFSPHSALTSCQGAGSSGEEASAFALHWRTRSSCRDIGSGLFTAMTSQHSHPRHRCPGAGPETRGMLWKEGRWRRRLRHLRKGAWARMTHEDRAQHLPHALAALSTESRSPRASSGSPVMLWYPPAEGRAWRHRGQGRAPFCTSHSRKKAE